MKVLLIDDQDDAREKVAFALESSYDAKVTQASGVQKALVALQTSPTPFDVAVYDVRSDSSQELESFLSKAPAGLRVIPCVDASHASSFQGAPRVLDIVDRSKLIANLMAAIDKLVASDQLKIEQDEREFCQIKTKLLLSVCPLKGDIYIRLSEKKFVKLFREGDAFEQSDLEKYTIKKGIEYLHIRKGQVQEFIRKYTQELERYLEPSSQVDITEAAKLGASVIETVQELGKRVGFTKEIQHMAKAQVVLSMRAMGSNPKLADILSHIQASQGNYIGSHSTMTGFLACAIASHMEWGSETTFHKLNLAAFLHDITLDNPRLAACESMDEAKTGNFSADELKAYRAHPADAAQVAKQFSEVPPDVDAIILQHHERPDGKGFPRGIGHTYIAPLAAVFIIAHEMTHYFLKGGAKSFDKPAFLKAMSAKYTSSQFRKVLTSIEQHL